LHAGGRVGGSNTATPAFGRRHAGCRARRRASHAYPHHPRRARHRTRCRRRHHRARPLGLGVAGSEGAGSMSAILRAILEHHIWANDTLYGFCESLTAEQLALTAPGTYGPVHDTLVHLADAEVIYLSRIPESGIMLEFEGDTDSLPSVAMLRASLRRTG